MSGYYIIPIPNNYLNLSGGTVTGGTLFSANLSANTFYLTNTPNNNNLSNYVLVYNSSTGQIEYRDASSIGVLGNFLPISGGTLTGQLNVPSISGSSITGFTFYSGSTLLENIFPYSGTNIGSGTSQIFAQKNNDLLEFRTLSAGTNIDIDQTSDTVIISFTGNTIPNIEDGLNTYTSSTLSGGVSINVSGLTVDNLTVSGNTNIWNLSSYTISANTIYSGSTPIQGIFPYSGTNIGSGITGVFAQKNNDLLEFKTLSAGTKVSITGTNDTVIIQTSGINSYYIQTLAPSGTTNSPLYDGDRWFNTTNGLEFVYIDDGNSSQWVEVFAATPQYENYGTYEINVNSFNLSFDYFYYGIIYDGAVNLYLPSCTGLDGKKLTIKDELGNCNQLGKRIRISGATAENIDGNNYVDMAISKMSLQLISRANNWYII